MCHLTIVLHYSLHGNFKFWLNNLIKQMILILEWKIVKKIKLF